MTDKQTTCGTCVYLIGDLCQMSGEIVAGNTECDPETPCHDWRPSDAHRIAIGVECMAKWYERMGVWAHMMDVSGFDSTAEN